MSNAANIYTLENLVPMLKAIELAIQTGNQKILNGVYKLPRYRTRREPYPNPAGVFERRFTLQEWRKDTGNLYRTTWPWGSFPTFTDHREACWDYVRNPSYKEETYGKPSDTGSEFLKTSVKWLNHRPLNYDKWEVPDYSSLIKRRGFGRVGCLPYAAIHDGMAITADSAMVPQQDYDISSWGPTAWKAYKPAKPTLSLAVFIGESRDLPSLLKARVSGLKTLSDWHLAVQFGWLPTLRDIMSMINFVDKVNKQVEFIYHNAGKPIRRGGTVTTRKESELIVDQTGAAYSGLSTMLNGRFYPLNYSQRRSTVTFDFEQSIRFAGSFVFWFNGKPPDYTTLAAKLAGLELTPQVVWNLLPWSWLVDWFSNLGDVIDNINTEVADRQTSPYAYITGKTVRRYRFAGTDGYLSSSIDREFRSTVRLICHPFGLSANTALTLRQASILSALGISRSPRLNP